MSVLIEIFISKILSVNDILIHLYKGIGNRPNLWLGGGDVYVTGGINSREVTL